MAPKNYQQRQQAAAMRATQGGSNNRNKPNNRPKNAPKPKRKPAAPTTPADEPSEGAGYYDSGTVDSNGDLFDPNSGYGRAAPNPNIPDFQTWAQQQGYNLHHLKPGKKDRIRAEYDRLAGPETSPDNPNGDWYGTPEGENFATNNRDDYTNWLMARAGGLSGDVPIFGGPDQFGQFLANDYVDNIERGYQAARDQSGGQLGFTDYMRTLGWGPGQNNSFDMPLQPAAPAAAPQPFKAQDTGNPFTSTSMPATAQAVTPNGPDFPSTPGSFRDYRQDQGIGQHQWQNMNNGRQKRIRNAFMGGQPTNAGTITPPDPTSAATLPDAGTVNQGVDDARRQFLALTPQQRGINPATSFRPGRWSVF